MATVPLTRFHVRTGSSAGGHHGPAGARGPAVGRHPLPRRRRRRPRRGGAAQDRAALLPGGVAPRARGGDRRHRLPAAHARALHRSSSSPASTSRRSGGRASSSCSTTPTARRASSCRTCSPSSAPRCSAVNPHVSTVGVMGFDRELHARRLGDLVRSSGAHLGAVIDPDGEQLTLVDDTGRVLSRRRGAARARSGSSASTTAAPASSCRSRRAARWRGSAPSSGARLSWAKLRRLLAGRRRRPGRVDFAGNACGGYAFPEFLPAYDAVATLVHLLDLLAQTGAKIERGGRQGCRRRTWPTSRCRRRSSRRAA